MAIIRWNPFNLSSILDDDFDLPTIPGLSRLGQGLNIYETKEALIAEAALPGVKEDQIDVTIDDGVVRISGQVENKQEESTQRRYFMTSMASSFNYSFRIPESLLKDKEPEATFDNGVLTLTFEKTEKEPPKKVAVKVKAKKEVEVKKS